MVADIISFPDHWVYVSCPSVKILLYDWVGKGERVSEEGISAGYIGSLELKSLFP